jgi:hypothetical protein
MEVKVKIKTCLQIKIFFYQQSTEHASFLLAKDEILALALLSSAAMFTPLI